MLLFHSSFSKITFIVHKHKLLKSITQTSLVVQWLELCTRTTEGMGSLPGPKGSEKIPHAVATFPKYYLRVSTLLAPPNSPSSPFFTLVFPSSLPAYPLGILLASFISFQAHKHGFSELHPGLLPFSLTLGNILTASASPVIRMVAIPSLFLRAAIHLDSSIGTWKSTYPNPNFH